MKLTVLDQQNMPLNSLRNVSAAISFAKSGLITINGAGVKLLGITTSDKLSIAQDSENTEDWYLFIDNKNGFSVRAKDDKKYDSLSFNHKQVCLRLLESLKLDTALSYRFLIAGKPTIEKGISYYCILIPFQ